MSRNKRPFDSYVAINSVKFSSFYMFKPLKFFNTLRVLVLDFFFFNNELINNVKGTV